MQNDDTNITNTATELSTRSDMNVKRDSHSGTIAQALVGPLSNGSTKMVDTPSRQEEHNDESALAVEIADDEQSLKMINSHSDTDEEEGIVMKPRIRNKRPQITGDEDDFGSTLKKIRSKNETAQISVSTDIVENVLNTNASSNEDEDHEGKTKVDVDGCLKGDRVYACRAFRLPARDNTYYFLATEIARVSGYRDSYLLFNKNRNLKKSMTTESEKAYLIANELIPYSYRNRQIGVVNALSIFKTFGAKVIQRGRRVRDDYFAQRARDQGFTEDDFANEEDRPRDERLNAQAEMQKRAETDADIALANTAKSAVDFNESLNHLRKIRETSRYSHFKSLTTLQRLM